MSRPGPRTQPYLQHFGVRNATGIEDRIIETVRSYLGAADDFSAVPVRLSRIAPHFGITPTPVFTNDVANGQLRYEDQEQRFLIAINPHNDAQRPRIYETDLTPLRGAIKGRLRFTYAHEFAHRFFFIATSKGTQRLLHQVLDGLNGTERTTLEYTLSTFEEALCDRIAARLLIPDELLPAIMKELHKAATTPHFFEVVNRLVERLAVTRECLLVRAAHTARGNSGTWTNDRICLLIANSTRSGSRRHAQRKLRIKVLIATKGAAIGHTYPGMPVKRLGTSFEEKITALLNGSNGVKVLNVPIGVDDQMIEGYAIRIPASNPHLLVTGTLERQKP